MKGAGSKIFAAGESMKNIVLVGFMGTGKTSAGRIAARWLNYQFVDTDELIEKATGLTVSQIFQKYGEIRFRSEESLVVRKLASQENMVIATGGGLVINPENVRLLKENSVFILLTANSAVILERVSRRNTRPLLAKSKTIETIEKLYAGRREYYEACSDYTVDTSNLSLDEAAGKIIHYYREEEAKNADKK